jgi:hypothetical protein
MAKHPASKWLIAAAEIGCRCAVEEARIGLFTPAKSQINGR